MEGYESKSCTPWDASGDLRRGCSAFTVVSQKRAHGRSTLQVCQRGGKRSFHCFLTTKEHPRHVHSDSKPSKQIIGHKITYNGIINSFEVDSWWHTTLWTAQYDGERIVELAVLTALATSIYAKTPWLILVKYYTMFITWDTHSAQGHASQTPCEARSRVGTHSTKLWPYARNWAKIMGWALFCGWALFPDSWLFLDIKIQVKLQTVYFIYQPHPSTCSLTTLWPHSLLLRRRGGCSPKLPWALSIVQGGGLSDGLELSEQYVCGEWDVCWHSIGWLFNTTFLAIQTNNFCRCGS